MPIVPNPKYNVGNRRVTAIQGRIPAATFLDAPSRHFGYVHGSNVNRMSKRILSTLLVLLAAVVSSAQWVAPNPADIPAYHGKPPAKTEKLPPILSGAQLTGDFKQPVQRHAYEVAAKIPNTLYQLPCYCHCDRSVGHRSLRSCFESEHGAHCGTCMAEAFYAYKMHKQGKTIAQIREGVERGDFNSIDL